MYFIPPALFTSIETTEKWTTWNYIYLLLSLNVKLYTTL